MPIPTSITQLTTETPSNSSSQPNSVTDSEIPTSGASSKETNESGKRAEEDRGVSGVGGNAGEGSKMSAEEAAERLYEERMEDEYAKREGGA
jgi:hypothetical protein